MGKRSTREKDGETRVLYKKSQTVYTQSKTCSGFSDSCTKSGIIQIKKTLSQTNHYYTHGEKIKRDLSIETDICILRRVFKKKKIRRSLQEGSKSKYSTMVETEIDTIDEYQHDSSACGDTEPTGTNQINLDIGRLLSENFDKLLYKWVEKYLLDNKNTKNKIESVLYSILHKTELDISKNSSSRSTYILNKEELSQEVKKKKVATPTTVCQRCKHKQLVKSSKENAHSSPVSHKNIKLISTLSIPKNLHKKTQDCDNHRKIKKTKHKNLVLSIDKSSKMMVYSSFDLLTVSTRSFTKRCVTYDCDDKNKNRKKKRHIVFFPKPFYKSATDSTPEENRQETREMDLTNLDALPSLVKSIYADDPANVTSTDDNTKYSIIPDTNNDFPTNKIIRQIEEAQTTKDANDFQACDSVFLQEYLLNEEDKSDHEVTIDFINESNEFPHINQPIHDHDISTKTKATDTIKPTIQNNKNSEKRRHMQCRRISKLYKTLNKRVIFRNKGCKDKQSQKFLGQCQNILQFFADYEHNNNMKLDIHITVLPMNNNSQNKSTSVSRHDVSSERSDTMIYNVEHTYKEAKPKLSHNKDFINNDQTNIIPLLDGADNQSKYVFKSESYSVKSHENTSTSVNRSTITEVEIKDDISELKSIIRELSKAAEIFVKEHIRKHSIKPQYVNNNTTMLKSENISKGQQFSKDLSQHPFISGIKLSKEPKRVDVNDFYNRLIKKSTSYNIIDSESILRVTDMTSAANQINNYTPDNASEVNNDPTKSLPISKSMIEFTDEIQKQKLLSYYCKEDHIQNTCKPATGAKKWLKPKCKKTTDKNQDICVLGSVEVIDSCYECNNDYSNTCYSVSNTEKCNPCPVNSSRRLGMGFGEGCVYCLLMWIPVLLVASLLYSYVIKDAILPKKALNSTNSNNTSPSPVINLSDLGF